MVRKKTLLHHLSPEACQSIAKAFRSRDPGKCADAQATEAFEWMRGCRSEGTQLSRSDSKAELAESLAMIDRSMEDIRTGRTQAAKPALEKLADELGLKLDR